MLKNFLYLDTTDVGKYISQIEDGLRGERKTQTGSGSGGGAGLKGGPLHADFKGDKSKQENISYSDTPEAQFQRLLDGVKGREDELSWIDVLDPENDVEAARIGFFISGHCEVYVPSVSKALGDPEQLKGFADLARGMQGLGIAPHDSIDLDQMDAMVSFAASLGGTQTLVGEFEDTEWKVFGQLKTGLAPDDIDGLAVVVGKVTAIIPAGRWKSLITLPGMQMLSRSERREQERKGPNPGDEDNWVQGPALMLDILAVYR